MYMHEDTQSLENGEALVSHGQSLIHTGALSFAV